MLQDGILDVTDTRGISIHLMEVLQRSNTTPVRDSSGNSTDIEVSTIFVGKDQWTPSSPRLA